MKFSFDSLDRKELMCEEKERIATLAKVWRMDQPNVSEEGPPSPAEQKLFIL